MIGVDGCGPAAIVAWAGLALADCAIQIRGGGIVQVGDPLHSTRACRGIIYARSIPVNTLLRAIL